MHVLCMNDAVFVYYSLAPLATRYTHISIKTVSSSRLPVLFMQYDFINVNICDAMQCLWSALHTTAM